MSQPQVPRDQQCSQHCWACAVVSWPPSSSVTLSESPSCKSGLGSFEKNSLHHVMSWSSLGQGRRRGGGYVHRVGKEGSSSFWRAQSGPGKKPYLLLPSPQDPVKNQHPGVPVVARWVKNRTSIHEDAGLALASLSGLKDPVLL